MAAYFYFAITVNIPEHLLLSNAWEDLRNKSKSNNNLKPDPWVFPEKLHKYAVGPQKK